MSSSDTRKWIALVLLCATQFMVVLDVAIVNVALPSIQDALDFSQENLQWVVSAYTLTFGGFLLLGGRTADLLGRRRVFLAGLALFSAASLACGLAQTDTFLIAARAVQGVGAAVISPGALSILMTTFKEGSERNKALGIWGAIAGVGGAAGVLLGGILTDTLGWEWIFLVNVPVGIAVILLTPRFVAESRAEGATRSFDVAGAVSVTAGLALLVYALVNTDSAGWASGETIGLMALSAALIVSFVVIEMRAKAPLLPLSIFRLRSLTGANIVGLLLGAAIFSMFFFLSLYMQQVLGYSALRSGFAYLLVGDHDHHRRRGLAGAGHALRVQDDPRHRHGAAHAGPALVHDDRGQRLLRDQPRARASCSPASASGSPSCRSRSPPSRACRPTRPASPRG